MSWMIRFILFVLITLPMLAPTAVARESGWDPNSYYNNATYRAARQSVIQFSPDMTLPGLPPTGDPYDQDYDLSWASLRTFRLMSTLQAPIKVYIETHPQETRLYKARYVGYVQEGLNAWSDALDGRLRYTVTNNPNEAQIRVTWVSGFAVKGQAGETDYTVGDATIQLQTPDMPDNILRANILHELGHALGIGEHSTHNSDIMRSGRTWASYQEYVTYEPTLTEHDKQAIRRLYSLAWHPGEDLYRAIASQRPARLVSASPTTPRQTHERIIRGVIGN